MSIYEEGKVFLNSNKYAYTSMKAHALPTIRKTDEKKWEIQALFFFLQTLSSHFFYIHKYPSMPPTDIDNKNSTQHIKKNQQHTINVIVQIYVRINKCMDKYTNTHTYGCEINAYTDIYKRSP